MPSHIKDPEHIYSEVIARSGEEISHDGLRNTSSAKFGNGDPAHDFDPSDPSSRIPQLQARSYVHGMNIRDQYLSIRHFQDQHLSGPHFPPDEIRRAHHAPRSGMNFSPNATSTHSYHYTHNAAAFGSPARNFHQQQPSGDNGARSSPQAAAGGHVQQTPQRDRASSDLDEQEKRIEASPPRDDSEAGCTCKKSKCLKLYCMCFAAKAFCDDKCRCLECKNDPRFSSKRNEAIQVVLARNPLAFENKFKPTLDKKETPQHKSGCKCRKSMCLKKYCECFHAQVNCSLSCRCVGCKNMPPGMERPFSDHHSSIGSTSTGTATTKFNVYDAAHNLAFLKNTSPSKEDKRQVSCLASDTRITAVLDKEEKKDDTGGNNRVQSLHGKEEKTESMSTSLDCKNQEILDDKLAADLLLQAAVAMTKREPRMNDFTHTPEKNIPSSSDFGMNHHKRQLIEPKVPTMDPKRSKFEKDCKSPNSATANTVSQRSVLDESRCPKSDTIHIGT